VDSRRIWGMSNLGNPKWELTLGTIHRLTGSMVFDMQPARCSFGLRIRSSGNMELDADAPEQDSLQPIQHIVDNDAGNDPPVHAFRIPDARLAVGIQTNRAELQSLIAAYAAERNFRCTMHYNKKKECITWQCERGGLSEKEMRSRRQFGDAPPKRKSPNTGSSKSEAIVINEGD